MERTKFRIPDAINCSPYLAERVSIPHSFLRNPQISLKAKGLLALLLANSDNWESHLSEIQTKTKDGRDAISTALKELQQHGYFYRVRYRSKESKTWRGTFWMYTDIPHCFSYKEQLEYLEARGLEPQTGLPGTENPCTENPCTENPCTENPRLKITINKNNNIKNNNGKEASTAAAKNGYITASQFEDFWNLYPRKVDKGKCYTKWKTICGRGTQRPTWRQIKKAVLQQQKSERWQDTKFIPHPTTWLNQSRWMDNPQEMTVHKPYNKPKQGSNRKLSTVDLQFPKGRQEE